MDIKIPSELPATKPAVTQVDDLLAQLKAAGRIEAEVVKLLQGNKLLLSSRLGDILTSNSLNYKPGDRIYLQLDDRAQQPVLKTSSRPAKPVILDSRQNPQLARALPPDRPMLARVIKIIAQQAEIQLSEQILKLPREVLPVRNQLLSLQRHDRRHSIEITPLDSKTIYKAILKQLVPRQAENSASSLVKLLNLIGSGPARSQPAATQMPQTVRQQPSTNPKPAENAGLKPDNRVHVGARPTLPATRPASGSPQMPGDVKTTLRGTAVVHSAVRRSPPATSLLSVTSPNILKPGLRPITSPPKDVDPINAQRAAISDIGKSAKNGSYNSSTRLDQAGPVQTAANPVKSRLATVVTNPLGIQRPGAQTKMAGPISDQASGQASKLTDQAAVVANTGTNRAAGLIATTSPSQHVSAGVGASPALQPLLQLITRFPEIDASALKKWLEFARLIYKPKSEAGNSSPVDIFRVLKQFNDGESFSRELAQVLKQTPRAATDADSSATRAAAQEALLQQVREGVKLVEQSLSHNLLQRATLGLQQETQQPFSLSLALPFLQDQQTKALYIDLEQRKRGQQDEDKSWDIRLNFELAGLGPVSCHLVLEGHAVGASFYSERAQTRERIEMELPLFATAIVECRGFTPGEFHSFPGKPAPDRTPAAARFRRVADRRRGLTMNRLPKFAIALEYDGKQAPQVTAKGHDEIANQILKLAQESNVPIHLDKDLALVLDQVDLGEHIPEALYLVIAEILTFAYRISGKHKDFMDDIKMQPQLEQLRSDDIS